MLPGAVLARMLLDLGARLIKVEQPGAGDPLRRLPPLIEGIGAAFCSCYRGAESITLDLSREAAARKVRKLARHADVLLESFRPGSLARWGLAAERLENANPGLIVCSLTGFAAQTSLAHLPGHDINFCATSGLLDQLGLETVPRVQIADVSAALLACSSILAALLQRGRTGRGARIEQPLALGPLPFLLWNIADRSGDRPGTLETLVAGRNAAYRLYRCADQRSVALGALEPKFWRSFLEMVGLPELEPLALDTGPAGREAAERIAGVLAAKPAHHWVEQAQQRGLPLTLVEDLDGAMKHFAEAGALEQTPLPTPQRSLTSPGPLLRSLGSTPHRPAPRLGADSQRIEREFGLDAL
jgi:crotonobetainyl-CoA:carnitine CoA-transferase CaiB-like acyl-CoA transferase